MVSYVGAVVLALGLGLAVGSRRRRKRLHLIDPARKTALDRVCRSLDGRALESQATLEDRVVVVNFFASWCPPCHPEFDYLKQSRRGTTVASGVTVISINIFEDFFGVDGGLRLRGFLAGKAPAFPVLGDGEAVAQLFGDVTRIPTLLVFARDGRPGLHFVHGEGAKKTHAGLEEIIAAVEAAL